MYHINKFYKKSLPLISILEILESFQKYKYICVQMVSTVILLTKYYTTNINKYMKCVSFHYDSFEQPFLQVIFYVNLC